MTNTRTNMFKATDSIAAELVKHGIDFEVANCNGDDRTLRVVESTNVGPAYVVISFMDRDGGSSATVKINGLFQNISEADRSRIMEACNTLNCMSRYAKFYLDALSNVVVEYDLFETGADGCIGKMAYSAYTIISQNLDSWNNVFAKAFSNSESVRVSDYNCPISCWHGKPEELRKNFACVNAGEDKESEECGCDGVISWLDSLLDHWSSQ